MAQLVYVAYFFFKLPEQEVFDICIYIQAETNWVMLASADELIQLTGC